jgi:hypothetical protein
MAKSEVRPIRGLEESSPETHKKVEQELARYEPPSHGPFKCGNCSYFRAPTTCQVLEGSVEAEGCCVLYEQKGEH